MRQPVSPLTLSIQLPAGRWMNRPLTTISPGPGWAARAAAEVRGEDVVVRHAHGPVVVEVPLREVARLMPKLF